MVIQKYKEEIYWDPNGRLLKRKWYFLIENNTLSQIDLVYRHNAIYEFFGKPQLDYTFPHKQNRMRYRVKVKIASLEIVYDLVTYSILIGNETIYKA